MKARLGVTAVGVTIALAGCGGGHTKAWDYGHRVGEGLRERWGPAANDEGIRKIVADEACRRVLVIAQNGFSDEFYWTGEVDIKDRTAARQFRLGCIAGVVD